MSSEPATSSHTVLPVKRCAVCGSVEQLMRCARCKSTLYCSKEHQKKHWPEHRTSCKSKPVPSSSPITESLAHHVPSQISTTEATIKLAGPAMPITGPQRQHPQADLSDFPEIMLGNSTSSHYARRQPNDLEDVCLNVIQDMDAYGLCVIDNFLGLLRGQQVYDEVLKLYSKGVFEDGQLVSNRGFGDQIKTIRSDQITWLDGREDMCSNIGFLIKQVDAVVVTANKMRNNGKMGTFKINGRTKAMVACYPGFGSHYVKHVDNPNKDGRIITAIYYLNKDWNVRDCGGLLRIFPDGCYDKVADIEPLFDRLLFFWSDRRNPHEVQPAFCTRYAITLWYFDAEEREAALRRFAREEAAKKSLS